MLHGQAHPLGQRSLRHGGVLVEVVPAGHDDEHVVYPDPFVSVKNPLSVDVIQSRNIESSILDIGRCEIFLHSIIYIVKVLPIAINGRMLWV